MLRENTAYCVRLSAFEGPLDLLLHLVHKAQIDLRDIFVSEITDQYLRYMEQVHDVDLERASAFLETASLLVYIKSRSLLPAPSPQEQELGEEVDPEAALIRNLQLYEAYKNASKYLETRERAGDLFLSKLPEDLPVEVPDPVFTGDVQMLQDALLRAMKRGASRQGRGLNPTSMQIQADPWSVNGQKRLIRSIMRKDDEILFTALFNQRVTAAEVAVTFYALLELWNDKEVTVSQRRVFGDLTLRRVDNRGITSDVG